MEEKISTASVMIPMENVALNSEITNSFRKFEGPLMPPLIPAGTNKGQPFDMNKIFQTFDELQKKTKLLASDNNNLLPHPTLIPLLPRRSNQYDFTH